MPIYIRLNKTLSLKFILKFALVVHVRTCGVLWFTCVEFPGFIQSAGAVSCCLLNTVVLLVRVS